MTCRFFYIEVNNPIKINIMTQMINFTPLRIHCGNFNKYNNIGHTISINY